MLVAGASRHAKEIVELLYQQDELKELYFFDDVEPNSPNLFYDRFPVLKDVSSVKEIFLRDNRFVLGLGGTSARFKVAHKLLNAGGRLVSIVASTARVGHFNTHLGDGLNIMEFVSITNDVRINEGCLLNSHVSIHHDVTIGRYCEIAPRATLLGGVVVGDFTAIGSGATLLPNVSIGSNAIVGAGAVVVKNVLPNTVVAGVPARVIRILPSAK